MATSFLGVALCLADFWADGLACEKKGLANALIHALTFLPSVLVVVFYPNAFVTALQYAGLICILLMMLMPTVMAWYGRYRRGLATGYRVMGGKPLLLIMMLVSMYMMVKGLMP
jgi:tyrosine-specific transport protein